MLRGGVHRCGGGNCTTGRSSARTTSTPVHVHRGREHCRIAGTKNAPEEQVFFRGIGFLVDSVSRGLVNGLVATGVIILGFLGDQRVTGQQQCDGTRMVWAFLDEALAGRDHRGKTAFHVSSAPAMQHSVDAFA